MPSTVEIDRSVAVSLSGTRDYYHDVTRQYGRYSRQARGWHYGVWDEGVTNHVQSLYRSNELLVDGLLIDADTHILDAGCGTGGFAIWAAKKFACKVTGITLVPAHVEQATTLADAQGVGHLCDFMVAEMDHLPFADGSFDLVTNQDSYCHAVDKADYLAGVFNVLRPGGVWQAIDFSVQDAPLDGAEVDDYRQVLEGFQIPSMISPQAVAKLLELSGFEEVLCRDITEHVLPSARYIQNMCRWPGRAMRWGLDWTFFGLSARGRRNRQGHVLAADAYSRGLLAGYFRHGHYRARKPAA